MSRTHCRGAVEWALMVALVFGAGAIVQAQERDQIQEQAQEQDEDAEQQSGPVIQIGRPDEAEQRPQSRPARAGQFGQEQPRHWIGLLFGPIERDSPLRAHLDLPDDRGLLVAQVVPNSPAEKAGLQRHDIILRANGAELGDRQELVDLVRSQGEKGEAIELEVLRRGQRETLVVKPEERPADAMPGGFGGGRGGGGALPGGFPAPEDLLREFGPGGGGVEFRQFGPGLILGDRGPGLADIPSGVSITVLKEKGEPAPARVTVKRGEQTWEVTADDPESLQQLPDDLRPIVEQMLRGGGGAGFRGPGPGPQQPPRPEFGDRRMRERLERMERQMEDLRRRLLDPEDENGRRSPPRRPRPAP